MKKQYGDLLIRDATIDDAEQLCDWWNDGAVMEHAGFPNGIGITVDKVREKFEDNSDKNKRHMIIYKNIPIGEMNYREVDIGICEIGIKICDFTMQNKGLGKIILSLFISELFNELGYNKIILNTNIQNQRAQHVYEKLGFKKIRTHENSWTNQLGVKQCSVDYELIKDAFVSFL